MSFRFDRIEKFDEKFREEISIRENEIFKSDFLWADENIAKEVLFKSIACYERIRRTMQKLIQEMLDSDSRIPPGLPIKDVEAETIISSYKDVMSKKPVGPQRDRKEIFQIVNGFLSLTNDEQLEILCRDTSWCW